jgi:hypothetical protein
MHVIETESVRLFPNCHLVGWVHLLFTNPKRDFMLSDAAMASPGFARDQFFPPIQGVVVDSVSGVVNIDSALLFIGTSGL